MEKYNSKCNNCGSELWFNPKQGCLTCRYCESNYILPKKKEKAVLVRQYDAGFHPNQFNQMISAYRCDTCGNIYYMSSQEKSKKCSNCGNSSCSVVQDAGYCADGIIPFRIGKEEASKELVKFLNSKKGIPKELKNLALNQKIMGVFVPVWNFSFNVSAEYAGNATELKKDSAGWYYGVSKPIFGDEMKRVPSLDESATTNETNDFLELFDENDYAGIIPYIPEYTYGYRVDAINKDIHDYYYEITNRAENEMKRRIRRNLNSKYKELRDLNIYAKAEDVFFNFTYVPVFINTYTYRGKTYKTYISGTTGKVAGKTPVSIKRLFGRIFKTIGVLAVLGLIGYLLI